MKRVYLSIVALCVWAFCLHAQNGEFDPANPGDPMPYYALTVNVSPSAGGAANITRTMTEEGQQVSLRITPAKDFKLSQWVCGDSVLGTDTYLYFTMPARNVVITAQMVYEPEAFNPTSPDDPQGQGEVIRKHQVTVYTSPSVGGSVNRSLFYMQEGAQERIYAYPNAGYEFVGWYVGDHLESTSNPVTLTMRESDVTFTARFQFNPSSPEDPGANLYDAATGTLIIDRFTPGYLSDIVYSLVDYDNYNNVNEVIIKGEMSTNDYGVLSYFTDAEIIDLSQTTGYTAVPSWSFEGMSQLVRLLLPATVETIGSDAFYGCSALSEIVLYAPAPPALEQSADNPFEGIDNDLVVHVPASSVSLYQASTLWGNFVILPMDVQSLNVSLPEDKVALYENMYLELLDTKSNQLRRYVITNRNVYSFTNVFEGTTYQLDLRNAQGRSLGQEMVTFAGNDTTVTFANLLQPVDISVKVQNAQGENVTDNLFVDWYDNDGKYLQRGKIFPKQIENDILRYRIQLPSALLTEYKEPAEQSVVVNPDQQEILLSLEKHAPLTISGIVLDSASRTPVSFAKVTVKQTIKAQTQKLWTAETDNEGAFTLQILDLPSTEIAVSASDYAAKVLSLEQLQTGNTVYVKRFTGTNLNIQLQYTPSVLDGITPTPQNWYGDYADFQFLIHNNTQNKWIDSYQFSYPQLQIKESVHPSDELAITVKSASGVFAPYVTTVIVDEGNRADLPLTLIERGGLRSSYAKSASAEVMAVLYDASGKQVGYQAYSDKSVVWNRLAPADYTLVSIKADSKLRSIAKLSDYEANGLHVGEDYILSPVTVSDGNIASIEMDSIPDFAEMMNYMGNNASFTANKSSLVVGDYLTLRVQLDFQQQYANAVSDAAIVVELPQSIEFIENAILVGGKVGSYSLNGQELTIPMSNYNDLVKFCVIPTNEGSYSINAYVQFTYQGNTCRQPLGRTTFAVDNASIAAILKYSTNQVIASGLTTPNSAIELYDNDELIAIAKAKPSGSWQIAADLEYAYNLSKHHVYASITTPDGLKMRTKTKNLLYNVSSNPDLRSIEMKVFEGGQLHADVTWDYEKNVMTPTFYQYTAAQASFEFYADFAAGQNENIKKVNLILYMHEGKHVLPLKYRTDIDKWFGTIGTGMLGEAGNGVINVGAEVYMESTEYLLDAELMKEFYRTIENLIESSSVISPLTPEEQRDIALADSLIAEYRAGRLNVELDSVTAETVNDILQFYDDWSSDSLIYGDELMAQPQMDDSPLFSRIDINQFDSIMLVNEGYDIFLKTNKQVVFIYQDSSYWRIVDLSEHVGFQMLLRDSLLSKDNISKVSRIFTSREACNNAADFPVIDQGLATIADWISTIETLRGTLVAAIEAHNIEMDKQLAKIGRTVDDKLPTPIKNILTGIQTKCETAVARNIKILNIIDLKAIKDASEKVTKVLKGIGGVIGGALIGKDVYETLLTNNKLAHQINDLYMQIPEECEYSENITFRMDDLANQVCGYGKTVRNHMLADLAFEIPQLAGLAADIAGAIPSGGVSLGVAVIQVAIGAIKNYVAKANKLNDEGKLAFFSIQNRHLIAECKENKPEDPEPEPEDPDPDPEPDYDLSPIEIDPIFPDLEAHIDPSGFVYEAVEDNRIEGVKATVYYKDTHENMFGEMVEEDVMWNAWDYDQENPQITDSEGKYQWFVPQGLWQVRFEKEGYEPTQSEWLPVPPPQLEVNIPIVQLRQPEVANAIAHKDAIDITFDKYMMPSLLNTDNIFVTANDQTIAGTIVMLDEQHPYDNTETSYASKVRFVPAAPFTASEITLTVSTRVHSYADVPLAQTFQQTFDVEDATVIEPAQTPVASIASGTEVELGTQVTLSCATEGAVIRYTMDGSEPDCKTGYIYSAPIVLYGNGSVTVKAIACAEGYDPSEVAQWMYSFPRQETAIEEVDTNLPQVSKLLRDGQLLILRGDKTYTVTGQEVR